jgi:2-oxoacid:acceptor oxidoreductase delta subunit (pyruvate/2-ketoisovalerate family)
MPRLKIDPKAPPVRVSTGSMAENRTGNWRSQVPVLHSETCTGCMLCWKFCPDACVAMVDGKPVIDLEHCKGCGICAAECPPKSLTMVEEAAR